MYKARNGIVKTKICNTYVLIPSRTAYPECQSMKTLSYFWAATWDAIVADKPMDKIVRGHAIITGKSEDECINQISSFCDELVKEGFLIDL